MMRKEIALIVFAELGKIYAGKAIAAAMEYASSLMDSCISFSLLPRAPERQDHGVCAMPQRLFDRYDAKKET